MSRILALILFLNCLFLLGCKESCDDGILNQDETFIDCGGVCDICETCVDGIQNQNEWEVDCGGDCPPCISCSDGILNQGESSIDCGGPCPSCETCFDGILNQNETLADCGGVCTQCTVSCPPESSSEISSTVISNNYYENISFTAYTLEELSTGIEFSFLYEDSLTAQLFIAYEVMEVGLVSASPLVTLSAEDSANGFTYSSFDVNSAFSFFISTAITQADCRVLSANINTSLRAIEDSDKILFLNIAFNNYRF